MNNMSNVYKQKLTDTASFHVKGQEKFIRSEKNNVTYIFKENNIWAG